MRRERTDRDQAYVEDILEMSKSIATYVEGKTFDDFSSTPMMADAVLRCLGVIGEAASKLTTTFKSKHPKADWKDIVGLRTILIHVYWQISPEKIWEIAVKDVPVLATYLLEG